MLLCVARSLGSGVARAKSVVLQGSGEAKSLHQ